MFSGASSFDQNLCRWDKDLTSYIAFCSGASCGTSNCPPSNAPSKNPTLAPSQPQIPTQVPSQNPTLTPLLSQIPTLAPSKAAQSTFITGLVALSSIIVFEII